MYRVLETEMFKKDIGRNEIAELIGVSYGTVCTRFNGKSEFSLPEAFKVRDRVSPGTPIEILFEVEAESA